MNFKEIAAQRQSCRSFDSERPVEQEKLDSILEVARLSPSACNSQPYHITVCKGESAMKVAKATQSMGMNKFTSGAPVLIVISECQYSPTAALGSKAKGIDYRSIDIGILTAYITSEATALGLSNCIIGWLDDKAIRSVCGIDSPVRLVIALGYADAGDSLRSKKRKDIAELVSYAE